MPLTITLASIKTSAREEHLASQQSDHLFQDQVTEERCDLKYFVDISFLDLVTTGQKKLQQSASTWVWRCKITGERVNSPESGFTF